MGVTGFYLATDHHVESPVLRVVAMHWRAKKRIEEKTAADEGYEILQMCFRRLKDRPELPIRLRRLRLL